MTGDLSESEKDSISRLVKGIEAQIGRAGPNDDLDLTRLKPFQDDEIASFSLTVKPEGKHTALKLEFTNDQDGRSLFLEQGWHHLNIRLENTPALSSSTQNEEALLKLVAHAREAMHKGKGNADEARLLTDAIGQIFERAPDAKDRASPAPDGPLTALPDYTIDYKRRDTGPGRSPDQLSLQLVQKTRISQGREQTRIARTQRSWLQAEFDEPLPHLESPDRGYGNFIANDLKENTERTTELAWDAAGIPIQAETVLKSESVHTRKTFNEGELESHDVKRQVLEDAVDWLLAMPRTVRPEPTKEFDGLGLR